MKTQRYTIEGIGNPPSFKNGRMIVKKNGRPITITAPKARAWMKHAISQLEAQSSRALIELKPPGRGKLNLHHEHRTSCTVDITVHIATMQAADIDGIAATIMDCLVRANILPDDGPRYVSEVTCRWIPASGHKKTEIILSS